MTQTDETEAKPGHWGPGLQCHQMATRNPLARGKRERERARAEKQKEKAARRSEARARRGQSTPGSSGVDRDIAGIVPGPQANPWGDEPVEPQDQAEEAEEK
jgi:hypothetical protein